jgi:hypothetical protein
MTVAKWLKQPGETFGRNDPNICELRIDGRTEIYQYDDIESLCGILWHSVDQGQEVGLWGDLLQYTDTVADPAKFKPYPRPVRGGRPVRFIRRSTYPRIFLNYRRDDSEAYAGRLHETLSRAFGREDVFMDIFSIRPGETFPWTVQQAVASCRVMVCVIGPGWLTTPDERTNRPRLESPFDLVRREVTAGLDRGIGVMPVLLPGASVPKVERLPPEMQGLEQVQMQELTPRHWDADADDLIKAIREALPE